MTFVTPLFLLPYQHLRSKYPISSKYRWVQNTAVMRVGRVFLSSAILLSFLLIMWRKNVFFGHLTSGIVLSEQEDTSALSQEKWRSGMRGSYISMHARGRRFLAARIPLYPNSSVHFNATRLVISGDVVSINHCLKHYQLLEAFHRVLFWVPSFSWYISMTIHLQYLIAMWIFTPMTLHYGWLILILCISNTDFRKSQQSEPLVLAKQDGPKRKENKTATSWNQAKTFLLHKPIA